MRRVVRDSALVATGLLIGTVGALSIAGMTAGRALTQRVAELSAEKLEQDFILAYRLGDYTAAACRLDDYTRLTSVLLPDLKGRPRRRVLLMSLGLSYARMAKAADGSGRRPERDRWREAAVVTFGEIGERPTAEQLQDLVTQQDAKWDEEVRTCVSSQSGTQPAKEVRRLTRD